MSTKRKKFTVMLEANLPIETQMWGIYKGDQLKFSHKWAAIVLAIDEDEAFEVAKQMYIDGSPTQEQQVAKKPATEESDAAEAA